MTEKSKKKKGLRERQLREKPHLAEEGGVPGGRAGGNLAARSERATRKNAPLSAPRPPRVFARRTNRKIESSEHAVFCCRENFPVIRIFPDFPAKARTLRSALLLI